MRDLLCWCAAGILVAGSALAGTDVTVGGIRMEAEANVSGVPGDVEDGLEAEVDDTKGGKEKALETVIAPIPSRSPLLGWTLSVPAMFMYRPPDSDPENQVWVTGAFGFYTENESWGAGLFHRMSLGGDQWRMKGAYFHAELNYDYFGIGGDGDGRSIPLSQSIDLVTAEVLYRLVPNLYAGLKAVYAETDVGPDIGDSQLPPGISPGDLRFDYTIASLNPRRQFDSRNAEFYPTGGFLIDLDVALSRTALGAGDDYEKYDFSFNNYFPFRKAGVVATRIATQYVGADAPFFVFPAFGSGADLRGYQTGTYRDRFLFAAQAEYRHRFTPRIGAVAFAGIGTVSDQFARWGTSLPSLGAGFRFVLAPKNNVGLRVDVARGRDDTIYYVGIGEAF